MIENAIDRLLGHHTTSTKRLNALADYLKLLLERKGLPGAQGGSGGELRVPGLTRAKDWDVAYEFAGKFRLLLSLKSVLANAGGSVPNRLDDLQGEASNIQQLRPEIVTGYVVLFDVACDSVRREDGRTWSDYFEMALKRMTIRRAPLWNQGLLEATWFIRFDSRRPAGQRLIDRRRAVTNRASFLEALLCELHLREPAIPFTRLPDCSSRQ